ncbi:MAG: hypothetical protein ABIA97_04455 [Candidatus Omnitrophota bacterium]
MKDKTFLKFLEAICDYKIPTTEGLMILNIVSFLYLINIRVNFPELLGELLPFAMLILFYAVLGLVLVVRDAFDFYKRDIYPAVKQISAKIDSDIKGYLEKLEKRVTELEKGTSLKLIKYAIFTLAAIAIMVDLIVQILIK